MKVLFVSGELIAADLCYRLKQEGCDVKLYIEDKSRKDCLDGMVEKTEDWEKELKWVGKDGLIVFDDVGYGKIQDELREQGYNVFGGSKGGDKLEKNREFGQCIFSKYGLDVVESYDFDTIGQAIKFVQKNRCEWVIKQNGHLSALNYVGLLEDGRDILSMLESYKRREEVFKSINLQRKVKGIEIGVARYFNGNDWIGPIEFNLEHKCLFNGGIGPMTGEMGTVMWYDNDENNRLFQATLARLKPHLQKINFKGDMDINCIVNKDVAVPIEATSRLGCPSTQLQVELHQSPWKEFLLAVAQGKPYNLNYKKGVGIVVSVSIPPFPYKAVSKKFYSKGAHIFFKKKLSKEEMNRIHFEEVSKKINGREEQYFVSGSNGFILYVTGFGKNTQEARKQAYSLVNKIIIPKMFYRTDIGEKFINHDQKKLKEWGWIK